ncbi:hypothetical protein ACP70R_033061 [Stipagrostis hirtigluma subsp. patula]
MSTVAMDAAAATAGSDVAGTTNLTAVGARLAAVCNMIEEHRHNGTSTMSARRAATISGMIDDVAATAAEGKPRASRRKRRMCNARSYKQVSRLGKGGDSVVVRVRHRKTGQDVAVKSLRRGRGADFGEILREACFMAACRGHPSHVALRCVARTPGTRDYSLVMDYVGPSLQQVLRERGRPFPEADVRRIMRQLLAGAEAMHEHGIVHRDIKPANILVGDGGAVKICGYGMAKSMAERDPPYCIAGTIGYMSPEVLVKNTEHGTEVDAWSLGVIMAELVAGKRPFDGEDEANQLFKIFDVLGVPCKAAWQALKPQVFDDEAQGWRVRQRRVGHRSRLREMFPEELLSKQGFEVLKGLLTCDPSKRLTAAAALRCPWFTDNVDGGHGPVASSMTGAAMTKARSLVGLLPAFAGKMAMMFAGRALRLLRPKVLFK